LPHDDPPQILLNPQLSSVSFPHLLSVGSHLRIEGTLVLDICAPGFIVHSLEKNYASVVTD